MASNTTGSSTQTVNQSSIDGTASPAKFDSKLDLLSGDDYIHPDANISLALVPLTEQQPNTPLSEQNALVPFDVHYDSNRATDTPSNNPGDQSHGSVSNFHQHQVFQSPQGDMHLNGTVQFPISSHREQSLYTNASGPGPSMTSQVSQSGQRQPLDSYNGSYIHFLDIYIYIYISCLVKLTLIFQTKFHSTLLYMLVHMYCTLSI